MKQLRSVRHRHGLVATLVVLVGLVLTLSGSALGDIRPAGCTTNGVSLTIDRTPSVVVPGGTFQYTVRVANVGAGVCDLDNAKITLTLPDGTKKTLSDPAAPLSLPAGTATITYPVQSWKVPDDGTFTTTSATASAALEGFGPNTACAGNPVQSYLHDSAGGCDSADTVKTVTTRVVDAGITITPATATNRSGQAHVYNVTVTAKRDAALPAPSFDSIVATVSPAPTSQTSTCGTPTISPDGNVATCKLTINSTPVGTYTANAAATVSFLKGTPAVITINRDTDPATAAVVCGPAGTATCGPGVKNYVNARITISPSSTALVGTAQTFTVLVEKDANDGKGWVPADGVTISSVGSGVGSITGGTCGPTGTTSAAGTCTVILNSSAPGSNTTHASGSVTVNGLAIAVATNGYGAHDIDNVKTWTAASVYVPRTDITVSKAATPSVVLPLGGGSRPIVYDMVVTNNGPDPATSVKVGDSAPADVTFVGATTNAGSCTTTASALDCSLGTIASGGKVTIQISATVNATGTKVNVVTVTTTTPETNTGNNTAQAQTIVTAPVTPPSPKPTPKPKPKPVICTALTAGPKTLKANGKRQTISVTVTKSKKAAAGVSVRIAGPGLQKTLKTGKNGKILYPLKTNEAGIIRVTILGTKACNSQRLGVVGVFEPPITG